MVGDRLNVDDGELGGALRAPSRLTSAAFATAVDDVIPPPSRCTIACFYYWCRAVGGVCRCIAMHFLVPDVSRLLHLAPR
ncbi:unnamed protein product [Lasius platythorax]|uniref:Uncharacterized protein n=1 Tax=Lasius platythorax TaxID=488582 RepID=A0AAV2P8K0_9HYME